MVYSGWMRGRALLVGWCQLGLMGLLDFGRSSFMFKYRTGILQIFMMAHDHDMYIHNTGIKKELGVKISKGFFGVEHYTDSPYEARNLKCTATR